MIIKHFQRSLWANTNKEVKQDHKLFVNSSFFEEKSFLKPNNSSVGGSVIKMHQQRYNFRKFHDMILKKKYQTSLVKVKPAPLAKRNPEEKDKDASKND